MKLLYGSYVVGQVLADGSVTLDLGNVAQALKERRGRDFDPPIQAPDEPCLVMCAADLVALQALASHKHTGPKTLRQRLKEWL